MQAGSTNVSVVIRIVDADGHTPETAVVWNTTGIALQYRREGAASVNITEATLAALTTAHTDGGFLHIGNGYYRLDLPDAACASGSTGVLVHGVVTSMIVHGCYIHLVAYNPYSVTAMFPVPEPDDVSEGQWGVGLRNIVYGLTDETIGQGPGVASAFNLSKYGVQVEVASVASAGDFTVTFIGYGGSTSTNNKFKGMGFMFEDGPNAGVPKRVGVYTGLTRRFQFTGTADVDSPFPDLPVVGNKATVLGRL